MHKDCELKLFSYQNGYIVFSLSENPDRWLFSGSNRIKATECDLLLFYFLE